MKLAAAVKRARARQKGSHTECAPECSSMLLKAAEEALRQKYQLAIPSSGQQEAENRRDPPSRADAGSVGARRGSLSIHAVSKLAMLRKRVQTTSRRSEAPAVSDELSKVTSILQSKFRHVVATAVAETGKSPKTPPGGNQGFRAVKKKVKQMQHSKNFLLLLRDYQKQQVVAAAPEVVIKRQLPAEHKSKLLADLEDYDPQPSAELQRKIDFYITPYNPQLQVGRHMTFDEPEPIAEDVRRSRSLDNGTLSAGQARQEIGERYWTFFLKRLFNSKNVTSKQIKNLERFVLLRSSCPSDYLTKLDLIDTHPALFTERGGAMSAAEIEQLRILVVGEKRPFGSRRPSERVVKSVEFKGLKKSVLPVLQKLIGERLQHGLKKKLVLTGKSAKDEQKAGNLDEAAGEDAQDLTDRVTAEEKQAKDPLLGSLQTALQSALQKRSQEQK